MSVAHALLLSVRTHHWLGGEWGRVQTGGAVMTGDGAPPDGWQAGDAKQGLSAFDVSEEGHSRGVNLKVRLQVIGMSEARYE